MERFGGTTAMQSSVAVIVGVTFVFAVLREEPSEPVQEPAARTSAMLGAIGTNEQERWSDLLVVHDEISGVRLEEATIALFDVSGARTDAKLAEPVDRERVANAALGAIVCEHYAPRGFVPARLPIPSNDAHRVGLHPTRTLIIDEAPDSNHAVQSFEFKSSTTMGNVHNIVSPFDLGVDSSIWDLVGDGTTRQQRARTIASLLDVAGLYTKLSLQRPMEPRSFPSMQPRIVTSLPAVIEHHPAGIATSIYAFFDVATHRQVSAGFVAPIENAWDFHHTISIELEPGGAGSEIRALLTCSEFGELHVLGPIDVREDSLLLLETPRLSWNGIEPNKYGYGFREALHAEDGSVAGVAVSGLMPGDYTFDTIWRDGNERSVRCWTVARVDDGARTEVRVPGPSDDGHVRLQFHAVLDGVAYEHVELEQALFTRDELTLEIAPIDRPGATLRIPIDRYFDEIVVSNLDVGRFRVTTDLGKRPFFSNGFKLGAVDSPWISAFEYDGSARTIDVRFEVRSLRRVDVALETSGLVPLVEADAVVTFHADDFDRAEMDAIVRPQAPSRAFPHRYWVPLGELVILAERPESDGSPRLVGCAQFVGSGARREQVALALDEAARVIGEVSNLGLAPNEESVVRAAVVPIGFPESAAREIVVDDGAQRFEANGLLPSTAYRVLGSDVTFVTGQPGSTTTLGG